MGGPPDKWTVLLRSDFATPTLFAAALSAAHEQGYTEVGLTLHDNEVYLLGYSKKG